MQILYKLTDKGGFTRNKTRWGANRTNTARRLKAKEFPKLCTDTVLHAYDHPYLASLMAPWHVSDATGTLWLAYGHVVVRDGSKVGVRELTTLHKVQLPKVTGVQVRTVSARLALAQNPPAPFVKWAEEALAGRVDMTANLNSLEIFGGGHPAARHAFHDLRDQVTRLDDLRLRHAFTAGVNIPKVLNEVFGTKPLARVRLLKKLVKPAKKVRK